MTPTIVRIATIPLAVAALAALTIAPAGAAKDKPAPKARSASDSMTTQDVSGLSVTRTWKIDKNDPNTLVATIEVQNTTPNAITTSLVEPIPTTSLKRITFTPLKMHTSSIPGLGRYDISVPPGGNLRFGYTAHLTEDRKASAQSRLPIVKSEMEATIPVAQATDVDRMIAAMKDRYAGPVELAEAIADGVEPGVAPQLGPIGTNILRLTPVPACYVVTRGCRFTAQDSFTRDPKLAALEPMGTALGGNGSADIAQSGLTCAGTEAPGVMDKHWTVEPTAWRLTWGGWEVSQVRFTVVADLTVQETSRCVRASVHTVTTGLLTADPAPTIRG